MTIPPRFLDEIRSRLTLSSVIGKKVKLTRAGREFKACCPFHREKSPSFYVNDDKQFYHCFGCGAHGDVIGFLMQHDNLSFVDAVEGLAAEAGLQMPRPDPADIQKAEKTRDLHALLDVAAKWMEKQLYAPANREVLDYLAGRGLRKETLAAFRIGFAPADRQAMRAFLKSKSFDDDMMSEAGLVKKNERGEIYAFFRERVMFPVTDRRGRVIAFSGRILPDHMRPPDSSRRWGGDYKPGKYINSPEGPLFDKGRTLYAEAQARHAARENKPVIVTEGQMDVIACHQAGFNGAVAPMGTALTEEQVLLMWSMIVKDEKVPVLCFDGDNAGRKAAARACERILPLLKPDQSVKFAFMPEGEDPDSLIKTGGAGAFQKILDGAISLFDFLWLGAVSGRDFSVPEVRAGAVKALNEEISRIADREVQKHYQALMQEKISEIFFSRGGKGRPGKIPALRPKAPVFRNIHARILLAALVNHPHIFADVEEALGALELGGERLERVRDAVFSGLSADSGLDRKALRHHLNAAGFEKEMDDILSESLYVHAGFAAPGADSASVAQHWLDLWQDMQKKAAQKEISAGWKSAFHADSPEEEERLKTIIRTG
jgi:DNA primase